MILEDVVEDGFGVQEVGAQDGVDSVEAAEKVFRHQVRGDA